MRRRILVVDDDASVVQLYRTSLVFAGFTVDTAVDGVGALRMIDAQNPDLIVLDLNMPGVDGFDVLDDLRANHNRVPVVVVTGSDRRDAVSDASAVLTKPCDPEALVTVVERHLRAA